MKLARVGLIEHIPPRNSRSRGRQQSATPPWSGSRRASAGLCKGQHALLQMKAPEFQIAGDPRPVGVQSIEEVLYMQAWSHGVSAIKGDDFAHRRNQATAWKRNP